MENINIIILDAYENFITWIDADKIEIKETNAMNTQRKISITYPLEQEMTDYESNWFDAGNKIFIPSTLGTDACLYVINQDANIDFWNQNEVTFEAEEVLVELNNIIFEYIGKDALKVNKENLKEWFGDFYDIGYVDKLDPNKNVISPAGTMSLMKLLRLIEKETGYMFGTKYSLVDDNIITRELRLKKPENLGTAHLEALDLNAGIESLDLIMDETDTYQAMAPELSLNENTADNINKSNTSVTTTGTEATTRKELEKVMSNWKALQVDYREYIPMIIDKTENNGVEYTAYWYAPFQKNAGDMFIYNLNYTDAKYKTVVPYVDDTVLEPQTKTGWVTTSETNEYAIYNALANELLKKTTPSFELNVDVKDIQLLTGNSMLGYNLHDKLLVKVPGIDYYIKCTVTKTVKNIHLPGENTIKLESNVESVYLQEETEIECNDQIIPSSINQVDITGILKELSESHIPLSNELVTINVSLKEPYVSKNTNSIITSITQTTTEFKPEEEYYTFSNDEIVNMANIIFNNIVKNNKYPPAVNMRATNGRIYNVPFQWCRALYYARNQIFLDGDENNNFGKGKYPNSLELHHYSNKTVLERFNDFKNYKGARQDQKYFVDYFYSLINHSNKLIKDKYFPNSSTTIDKVTSGDYQTGGDCLDVTVSNITELFFDYKTEKELQKKLRTKINSKGEGAGTQVINLVKYLPDYGYTVTPMNITKKNGFETVKKYVDQPNTKVTFPLVNTTKLPYNNLKFEENHYHAIACTGAFIAENGKKYLMVEDGWYPDFKPDWWRFHVNVSYVYPDDINDGMRRIVSWDSMYGALNGLYTKNDFYATKLNNSSKAIAIISCKNAKQKSFKNHTASATKTT